MASRHFFLFTERKWRCCLNTREAQQLFGFKSGQDSVSDLFELT